MPNNPDGSTTRVGEVVIVGSRGWVLSVYPPQYESSGPDIEAPGTTEGEETVTLSPPTNCQKDVARDRAALEAEHMFGELGLDQSVEWGFYMFEGSDGEVRLLGPVRGNDDSTTIGWIANASAFGLTNFSTLVGIWHFHPASGGSGDLSRRNLSRDDIDVMTHYTSHGASPSRFKTYIYDGNHTYQHSTSGGFNSPGVQVIGDNNCGPAPG